MLTLPTLIFLAAGNAPVDTNMKQPDEVFLTSPNRRIHVRFMEFTGSSFPPRWLATYDGKPLIEYGQLSLSLTETGEIFGGKKARFQRSKPVNREIELLFGKASRARDHYEELRLEFEAGENLTASIVFRCYDDAIAFRYEILRQKSTSRITIKDESTSFSLSGNPTSYVQYLENYKTSHEHNVSETPYQDIKR
ncbi:MAG: glycoside hydrolase family 97 N-terminal domain-containing protein, partial [Chlorobia bacterium]|nr:glycoside hydrolase family 97 N-terminal domain-containing protein [Fimbriimonadaceae bacterium]